MSSPKRSTLAPALTLMVLAPVIAEVMSGATRLSFLFALLPEILVWGGGALLIRELVRRWGGGWTSMLLLGLGLSMAEEFLIQQTSLAPLPWLGNAVQYGRAWGVNWIYFLYMLGFESVWVVLVPVQITELMFRDRREQTWLRTRGIIIVSIFFALGSFVAWFAWIKQARPNVFHVPPYNPAPTTLLAGFLAIGLLGVLAYVLRNVRVVPRSNGKHLSPWLVAIFTAVLALPWWWLMVLIFVPGQHLPFGIAMALGVAWAAISYFVISRWTSAAGWSDIHRWATAFSATVAMMAITYLGSSTWSKTDLVGKVVGNVVMVFLLVLLLKKLRALSSRGA
ncbi:hypothetical protein [Candidatus Korobacter versatilis]|uniref:hypothetical protein n=1 Tax=Candidatus Korobacter versatilis TaxID=658062 RepID=UPI00031D104D|nr:hypothetical protein [Candidatus Koribacter versatilis]